MQRIMLMLPLLLIVGCSADTSSGFKALLSGSWRGNMVSTNDPSATLSGIVRMNLQQSNAGALRGTVTVSDPETMCWFGGVINESTSSITGSRAVINFDDTGGATVVFDTNATDNTMEGIYNSDGGPCGPNSGTVRLNKT